MKGQLETRIRSRIKRIGPIPFSEFMEMALYDTEEGYYTTHTIGQDFYTSPSAHPVFGALLTIQLEEIWSFLGSPESFPVVELGAGRGTLGKDIKAYALHLSPEFAKALDYLSVEKYRGKIPDRPFEGCFLSNEFMDALPTHIVVKKGSSFQEVMVGIDGDAFVEVLGKPSPGVQEQLIAELESGTVILPEGYRTEVNLEYARWVAEMAKALKRGVVLTVDYGYPAHELYSTERRTGSLLCYFQHSYNEEPLQRVGLQDITSHVNFTSVIRAGEKCGLSLNGMITQREFLNNLGIQHFIHALNSFEMSSLERQANLYAMQELIRPEGMGSFKVLVQSKAMEGAMFKGLQQGVDSVYKPPVMAPMLSMEHLPLYQAKYSLLEDTREELDLWQLT